MSIKFVIDSASDIQPPVAAALGLTRLPLTVSFDGEEYQDGVDLSPREFYEKLIESDCLPTTSQITHAARESNPLYPVPRLMDQYELASVYRQLMPKEVTDGN